VRWHGGFLALRHFAEELAGGSAVRLWTEPLADLLLRARTGGVPTYHWAKSLEFLCGAHIDAGRFEQAAQLLRRVCEMHAEAAQQHGIWCFGPTFHAPTVWFQLGNLEAHVGRFADAVAAYRRGLTALDAALAYYAEHQIVLGPNSVDAELQITLPTALLTAAVAGRLPDEVDPPLLRRMFERHDGFRAATAPGTPPHTLKLSVGLPSQSSTGAAVVSATVLPADRTFSASNTGASGRWEIIELPRGATPRLNVPFKRAADTSLRERCVPGMVTSCCAGCGAARASGAVPYKTCASCGLVHYCGAPPAPHALHRCMQLVNRRAAELPACATAGKDCQVAHWLEHKAACKAARKAAAARAG
jgi:hypothetical protein